MAMHACAPPGQPSYAFNLELVNRSKRRWFPQSRLLDATRRRSTLNCSLHVRQNVLLQSHFCTRRLGISCALSEGGGSTEIAPPKEYPLPQSAADSVDQARAACQRAIKDGVKLLRVDLLLPLIGATELDDWPGGIQQQYQAAAPLVSQLLRGLLSGLDCARLEGGCTRRVVDEADAVTAWESDKIALLLFATAETLPTLRSMAEREDRPLLLLNPQWQPGQVVSDFGIGAGRRAAEEFVASFASVYSVKTMRMRGEEVRILQCYPGEWQVHVARTPSTFMCASVETTTPSYKQLQAILSGQVVAGEEMSWFDRLKREFKFNQDSLKG